MSTALQRQLATIRANSSNELDLKAQRAAHSKSLLFEPSIAATQSMDTIYQICYEGFEELCALDSRFVKFERTIFAPHSKNQDRQLSTAAENKDLDAVIEAFFSLVGARILLKPAIKAVEWLVRRFHVHEQNYEPLILTFLPFHSTPIFPTLLSILPKQLSPTLKFLHPYINQLKSPPRSVLVYAAAHNPSFFASLNRYVLNTTRNHNTYPVLMSFWASIMGQAVNDMFDTSLSGRKAIQSQREEDMLTRVLPTLNEALSMRHSPELLMGCYIIITILVSKANLDDRALDALLAAVLQSSTTDTVDGALSCSAVIAEKRESIVLPKIIFRSLAKIEDLPQRLIAIAAQQPIQRLVVAIVQTVLLRARREEVPAAAELLKVVVSSNILASSQKEVIVAQIKSEVPQMMLSVSTDTTYRAKLEDLAIYLEHINDDLTQHTIEDKMELDEIEDVVEASMSKEEQVLKAPPEADDNNTKRSFLTHASSPAFSALIPTFEHAARSKTLLDEFNALPFLQATTPLVTFFARVWTSAQPANVKCAALQAVRQYLSSRADNPVDCQGVLPYLLVALSDNNARVRRAAKAVLEPLVYHTDAPQQSREQDLYGSTTADLKWLSSKDFTAFLTKSLYPALAECMSDSNHISRVIADALGRHSSSTTSEASADKLRSTQKLEVFQFLTSHLLQTVSLPTQLFLLTSLNQVPKIGGYSRAKYLLPWLKRWAEQSSALEICQAQGVDQRRLDVESLQVVQHDDVDSMSYLMSLCLGETASRRDFHALAFERLITLWPELRVNRLTSTMESLLKAALSKASDNDDGFVQDQAAITLKSVKIQSEVLSTLVDHAVTELNHRDQPSASKRRRTGGSNVAVSVVDTEHGRNAVARLTLVMELVDGQRRGADINLFYTLFRVLQAVQDFRSQSSTDLGYIQNLTLGSLSTIMIELDKDSKGVKIDASHIRADLLVDCVRNTTSIQARNTALLLLSNLTRYIPQTVLHSIMPVFTLMSSTTLRQDDDFSVHVVDQTIQQVVPLLAQSLREQKKDLVAATAEIILSFAAAFEHIAAHRRLQLYRLLSSSLGPSESLFAIIATLVDHFSQYGENVQLDEVDNFVVDLFRHHQSTECLATTVNYLGLCLDSLQPKPALSQLLLKQENGFPVQNTSKLLNVLPLLLNDSAFRAKIKRDLFSNELAPKLRGFFADTLETMLKLSTVAGKHQALRPSCSQALESLLSLFPLDELALSVEPLLSHTDQDIRRSVLKTLELRIRTSKAVDRSSTEAAMQLLPRLSDMLQDNQSTQLKPNALAAIDQICERFGKSDSTAVLQVAQVIASPACIANDNEVVRVLSLHCLASVVGILQSEFIPLLQQVTQNAIVCLQSSIQTKSKSLHTAAYAFFVSLADNVPFMISKSSLRQIVQMSHESAVAHLGKEEDENRTQFLQLVATKVEPATVLDVAEHTWEHALKQGSKAAHDHLDMLSKLISHNSKSAISRVAPNIFRAILAAFDLRQACVTSSASTLYDTTQIDALESKLIALTIAFVFKINDTIFRPLFTQLLTWSSSSSTKRADAPHRNLRSTTFFNLVAELSDKLKSIFTSYFSYVLDRAAEILSANIPKSATTATVIKDQTTLDLTTSILRALTSGLTNDADNLFSSPNPFSSLLMPITAQLTVLPPALTTSHVTPCITALAASNSSSPDHLKALNQALLALLRHESARVRLAAVRTQMAVAERLGDEWLGMLPEMLPSIAELQDDDDEEVSRETERWIKSLEGILGESLGGMLQ